MTVVQHPSFSSDSFTMAHTLAVVLFACVAAVTCNDIQVGSNHGRIIFDEKIQASPAIWKQVQKITINTTNNEVINAVVVADHRPEKDGVAKIVEGGKGHKNVTIELESPTVFRGFDFNVVVYAVQEDVDGQVSAQYPVVINDTQINVSAKPENKDVVSVNSKDIKPIVPGNDHQKPVEKEGNPSTPVTTAEQNQQHIDSIVQYVNKEQSTEFAPIAGQKTTLSTQKVNGQELTKDAPKVNVNVTSTAKPDDKSENKDQHFMDHEFLLPQEVSKDDPKVKDSDAKVHKEDHSTSTEHTNTGAAAIKASTIPAQMKQQNFDSISQELGQKVVFGIKKY